MPKKEKKKVRHTLGVQRESHLPHATLLERDIYHQASTVNWHPVATWKSHATPDNKKSAPFLRRPEHTRTNARSRRRRGGGARVNLCDLGWREMMEEGMAVADLRELAHLPEHQDADEIDGAEPWIKLEHVRSPCENQDDIEVCFSDDNASGTRPIQESYARETSSGQSSMCHLGKNRHSPCRSAEGSDQNFIDDETKGSGQPSTRCSKKRLKCAANTMDNQSHRKPDYKMLNPGHPPAKVTDQKDNSYSVSWSVLQA
uniref:Uncharacterized protein n=2 Tax=Leersia perrieri TaxID=77586 RepID=A0A0D9X1J7_9ORYZ